MHAVIVGQGDTTITGGETGGVASYKKSTGRVIIDLATSVFTKVEAGVDALFGVNAIEGSDYNDQLVGNTEGNILDGGRGHDFLAGGAGDDTYRFGDDWGKDTVLENADSGKRYP